MACTYMLQCSDDSLYTGYTTDLQHRVMVHSQGKASKCTRAKLPVKLVYFEEFATKEEAQSREWHIKHFTRAQKLKLLETLDEARLNVISSINQNIAQQIK
ncbi:MAG: GIY-YIG nuclease family protein [Anaerovibrio sp.]|nr:GIY-YIG nuclease family protein [Selenomonadaceae bacterium]MDD6397130.1 GIY-YIG nuclease family protein [Selenomonadaceae bacterium]MDY6052762.1 GIY-YIG nuclease family protein [Anaerovibrio sp.]